MKLSHILFSSIALVGLLNQVNAETKPVLKKTKTAKSSSNTTTSTSSSPAKLMKVAPAIGTTNAFAATAEKAKKPIINAEEDVEGPDLSQFANPNINATSADKPKDDAGGFGRVMKKTSTPKTAGITKANSIAKPLTSDVPQPIALPPGKKKHMIGYYAGWANYARNGIYQPKNSNFNHWTRMTYAFWQADTSGYLHGTDEAKDGFMLFGDKFEGSEDITDTNIVWDVEFSTINKSYNDTVDLEMNLNRVNKTDGRFKRGTGMIDMAHKAGAEVYMSIGGWTLSSNFHYIAAKPLARKRFAQESVKILKEMRMDGIDIDWEYPAYKDHHGKPEDKQNAILFLQELRNALDEYGNKVGRKFGLTMAMSCSPFSMVPAYDFKGLNNVLNEFNLMSYDLHGAWDDVANHNANLYPNGIGPADLSVHGCVENYIKQGVPLQKLNIGAGFYGRHVKVADKPGAKQIGGADRGYWPDFGVHYWQIKEKWGSLKIHWDEDAQATWATYPGGFLSFETEKDMVVKADYIHKRNLNGVIVWETSEDAFMNSKTKKVENPLADALFNAIERK